MNDRQVTDVVRRALLNPGSDDSAAAAPTLKDVWMAEPARLGRIVGEAFAEIRARDQLPADELEWAFLELLEEMVAALLTSEAAGLAVLRRRVADLVAALPPDLRAAADRMGYKVGLEAVLAQTTLAVKVGVLAAEILHGQGTAYAAKDLALKLCLSRDEKAMLLDRVRARLGPDAASPRAAEILDMIRMAPLTKPIFTPITRTPKRKIRVLLVGALSESLEVIRTVVVREGHLVEVAPPEKAIEKSQASPPQAVIFDAAAADAAAEALVAKLSQGPRPRPLIVCLPPRTPLPWGRVGTTTACAGLLKPVNRKELQRAIRTIASLL